MRHTKGPWNANIDGYVGNGVNESIAKVYIAHGDDYESEDQANAHLIAAAPEMFEALYSALDLIKNEMGYGAVTDEIQAAINKAKGLK